MKYFVFADVHSYFEELAEALSEKGFDYNNPEHCIISLGDLLDRGPDAIKCLEFVNNLPDNRKILIKGNHEDLLEDIFNRGYLTQTDYHNGTVSTIEQIIGHRIQSPGTVESDIIEASHSKVINKYLSKCIDYYELEGNIFVHGWVPITYKDTTMILDPDWKIGDWEEARWLNGMHCWDNNIIIPNKTIWCGHWHTSWGHSNLHNDGKEFLDRVETYYIDPETGNQEPHVNFKPFIDKGIVAMDSCCAVSHFINCEVIEID